MTQIRHLVDPEPVWTELKNAAVGFLFNQRQRERVPIKRDRFLIGVTRTFDRDIGAAGKLGTVEFGNHDVDLSPRFAAVKDAREVFVQPSLLFPVPPHCPQNRRGRW